MAQTKVKLKQLEKITSTNVSDLIDDGAISASKLLANVTDAQLGYLNGVTSAIQTQLNAKLASSLLKKSTDTPDWTSDLIAVTAKAIALKVQEEVSNAQIGGAMAFKGSWGTATIDSTVKAGWTFVYDSGTAPTGHTLEVGDMLIAKVNNPGKTTAANWSVVQANISGAVTSIESAVSDGQMAVFSGTGGKSIKKSSLTGILKAVSGVLHVANGEDLPEHVHNFLLYGDTGYGEVFTEKDIHFKGNGLVSTEWKKDTNTLFISANVSTSNGSAQSGKYVSGLSITNGVVTLTFGALPVVPAKTDWKTQVTPSGTLNGTNRIFTIPESIAAGTEEVLVNGQVITRGVDYTISSSTITLATDAYIPVSGDVIRVNYIKS